MLLTAGCSFVWGDELEGFDQDPPTHWGLTFTSIVARKLGIDYENRGVCGACNDSKTDVMHTLTKMKMLESYCDAAGIKLIQGVFHKRNWTNIMSILTDKPSDDSSAKILEREFIIDSIPDYKKWLISSIDSLDTNSRVGMGKGKDMFTLCRELKDMKEFGHPGELTQEVFAEFLLETFEKSNQKEV